MKTIQPLKFGLFVLLLTTLLGGCGKNPLENIFNQNYDPQFDCGFNQNALGQRTSWKSHVPVRFYIHESVPANYIPVIESSMKQWETLANRKLFEIIKTNEPGPLQPRQDRKNIIYWMSEWDADNPSNEQGRTTTYTSGNQIYESDIRINARDFQFYIGQATSARQVHFESLMVHELGHVLGLKHNEQDNSVMGPTLAASFTRSEPNAADAQSIKCEY